MTDEVVKFLDKYGDKIAASYHHFNNHFSYWSNICDCS